MATSTATILVCEDDDQLRTVVEFMLDGQGVPAPPRRPAEPAVPGLLPQAAADGKTARGAVRPDGSQVHLLSAFHVTEGRTMAQREVDAKTNEIPELAPHAGDWTFRTWCSPDALHGQRETARKIREDLPAHYLHVHQGEPAIAAGRDHRRPGLH